MPAARPSDDAPVAGGALRTQTAAIARCLPTGDIVEASAAWTAMVGRTPTVERPVALTSLLDESVDANLVRALLDATATRQAHSVELLCRGAGETPFWNDIVVAPADAEGSWLIFRDVTARRSAERALGSIPSSDRLLLERVQAGIVVHKANTEILYANAKATELLGVTAHSVVGAVNTDPR